MHRRKLHSLFNHLVGAGEQQWRTPHRLFDHLVGKREQTSWNLKAQRLGRLEIDRHLEL
jgi:hypothetical protein